jgi:hypothetical protein
MRLAMLILIAAFTLMAFSPGAYALGLPDTGQTQCWNLYVNPDTVDDPAIIGCGDTGQDGEYPINVPSYGVEGLTIVIDNNTGLMWQKEDDGALRDLTAAESYCENLNLGNLTGWRVPIMRELFGIVDFSRYGPAINPVFTNTKSMCYWARDLGFPLEAEYGLISSAHASAKCGNQAYVRCVRGESFKQILTDNADGTVTDHRSGLIWQKAAVAPYIWTEALTVCNSLVLGNADDWRLPNIKEIQSLLDPTLANMINPDFFPDYDSVSSVWTSTTLAYWPRYAFHMNLLSGQMGYGLKIDEDVLHAFVRCVRGNGITSVANLTVNASGAGPGHILSNPAGLNLSHTIQDSSTTQTKTFATGMPITVTATAIGGATVSWSGTCTAAGGVEGGSETVATCAFSDLVASKTISASFSQTNPLPPVMTVDVLNFYYSITEAYAQSSTFDIIEARAVTLNENLGLDRVTLLGLKGGYNSDYSLQTGYTTINGDVTISGGWVGLERIICNKLTVGNATSTQVIAQGLIIK